MESDESKARKVGPLGERFRKAGFSSEECALACTADEHEHRLDEAVKEHLSLAERVARTEDLHRIVDEHGRELRVCKAEWTASSATTSSINLPSLLASLTTQG